MTALSASGQGLAVTLICLLTLAFTKYSAVCFEPPSKGRWDETLLSYPTHHTSWRIGQQRSFSTPCLSLASLLMVPQLWYMLFISASTVLRQVVFGQPRFRFQTLLLRAIWIRYSCCTVLCSSILGYCSCRGSDPLCWEPRAIKVSPF